MQSIHKLASEIAFKGHEYIPFCHHCPFLKLTINVMTIYVIPVIVNIVVKVLLIAELLRAQRSTMDNKIW